jgi:hypothetical protein
LEIYVFTAILTRPRTPETDDDTRFGGFTARPETVLTLPEPFGSRFDYYNSV